jgi:hypothetical protein
MHDDADAIRNLLGAYGERIDRADFEGVGELFTHGALADEDGRVLARGASEVAAFYRTGTRLHDGSPRTTHQITGTMIDVEPSVEGSDGGDAHAVARSTYVVLQQTSELPLQPIITGRYRDRLVRIEGAWWFAERRFVVDLTGDLRHHLAFDLPQAHPPGDRRAH